MPFPYHFRRRKFFLTAIAVLAGLGLLAKHCSLLSVGVSTDHSEPSCLEYFTRLERVSKNWSNEFRSGNDWRDYLPFARKDGDDVIENVERLENFEKCVMGSSAMDMKRLNDIEARLFPYLDFETLRSDKNKFWPIYTRWDGQVYESSVPRFSLSDNALVEVAEINYDNGKPFWTNWQDNLMQKYSKGIVISMGVFQVSDGMRLIRVLRHLQNSLPIAIVHKGDLDKESQDLLIRCARDDAAGSWPLQELWFLDVSNVLRSEFSEKFQSFSNKWLAVLFSSFENTILLDADTVPFVPLDIYYQMEQYEKTGTVFFKDRKLTSDSLQKRQLRVFKRIVESLLGWDSHSHISALALQEFRDPIAAETIEALLLNGQKHHMESGLVVINKRRHLFNLLTSLSLHFSTIAEYFHGDKDWFWFAQFLRHETFTFHPPDASNVGRLGRFNYEGGGEFYQICSVQLSHTDLDGSLLWVNGGLSTCKKNSWDYDYEKNPRIHSMYDSVEALRDHYQTPVELEGVIIPEVNKRPWVNSGACARFDYCTIYREGEFGKLFMFNESMKQQYRDIVRVWSLPL